MFGNTSGMEDALNLFIENWGQLLNMGLAFATMLGLLAFGYSLTLLIFHSDNPKGREDAISKLVKSGITIILTGSFWLIVVLVYYMFSGN